MNFHEFVKSSKTVNDELSSKDSHLQQIDKNLNESYLFQTASTSFLIYLTSFTIRTLFIKKFSPSFGLATWDFILPLCYFKMKSKEYSKAHQVDGIQSKIDQMLKGKMQEDERQKFLKEYNMKFWTNSQYWH